MEGEKKVYTAEEIKIAPGYKGKVENFNPTKVGKKRTFTPKPKGERNTTLPPPSNLNV